MDDGARLAGTAAAPSPSRGLPPPRPPAPAAGQGLTRETGQQSAPGFKLGGTFPTSRNFAGNDLRLKIGRAGAPAPAPRKCRSEESRAAHCPFRDDVPPRRTECSAGHEWRRLGTEAHAPKRSTPIQQRCSRTAVAVEAAALHSGHFAPAFLCAADSAQLVAVAAKRRAAEQRAADRA